MCPTLQPYVSQVPLELFDPFGLSKNASPEKKEKGLLAEINNGRLAMLGIMAFVSEAKVPGDISPRYLPHTSPIPPPYLPHTSPIPLPHLPYTSRPPLPPLPPQVPGSVPALKGLIPQYAGNPMGPFTAADNLPYVSDMLNGPFAF